MVPGIDSELPVANPIVRYNHHYIKFKNKNKEDYVIPINQQPGEVTTLILPFLRCHRPYVVTRSIDYPPRYLNLRPPKRTFPTMGIETPALI